MPTKNKEKEINFQNPKTGVKNQKGPVFKWSKKKAVILVSVFVFFLLALLLASLGKRSQSPTQTLTPTSTPSPDTISSRPASAYASDSAILNIEENLQKIEADILQADFYETALNPPTLDLNVSF